MTDTVCFWCGTKDSLTDIGKELDDGKYKMVQCSKCKNAYYVVNREKMNKPKPQTNEEYLKSCTTEQLAEFLYDIAYFDNWSDAIMNDSLINETAVEDAIEKWLKQPHIKE